MATFDILTGRLERIQSQIAFWESKGSSSGAEYRLGRLQKRLERTQSRLDALEPEIELEAAAPAPEPESAIATFSLAPQRVAPEVEETEIGGGGQVTSNALLSDSFSITLQKADDELGFDRFEFTIFDSPFDDTFTGGDRLMMEVSGEKSVQKRFKFATEKWTSRSSLANGQYWEGLSEQTLFAGGYSVDRAFDFNEVTVTLAKDNGGGVADWANADVLATETIDMTQFV